MLNKLLSIQTLENTEPVVLEEVDDKMAAQMPAEYMEHLENSDFDYEADPFSVFDENGEEEEAGEVDNGNA